MRPRLPPGTSALSKRAMCWSRSGTETRREREPQSSARWMLAKRFTFSSDRRAYPSFSEPRLPDSRAYPAVWLTKMG